MITKQYIGEVWRPVRGYEGLYEVSNYGRVKSLKRNTAHERIMKPIKDSYGYLIVCLNKNGKQTNKKIHRLVAEAFIPNPNNLPQVNHKNEIKTDNRVENLEWCDNKYNTRYGTRGERIGLTRRKTYIFWRHGYERLAEYRKNKRDTE